MKDNWKESLDWLIKHYDEQYPNLSHKKRYKKLWDDLVIFTMEENYKDLFL